MPLLHPESPTQQTETKHCIGQTIAGQSRRAAFAAGDEDALKTIAQKACDR